MRYAIFGDVHGNTEAMNAVFADIEGAHADKCLCLGDIVGYGAEPSKCIEGIRARGIEAVLGNHDSAAAGDTPLDYFNEYAKEAVIWTAERLTEEDRGYLMRLPLTIGKKGFEIVHSSLADPKEWNYVIDLFSARRCFELLRGQLCFIGHSHVPVIFQESGSISCYRTSEIAIEKDARYIINVGSVGQPRDGDHRASYGIYDDAKMVYENRRVPYDLRKAQDKILSAGLPKFLALRLGVGR